MGVATGCGCKEVYRFPHTTYPREVVSTLHCVLENRVDLHVNERQKIRHYRARSTEERRRIRRRMPNRDFLLRAVRT